MSFLTAIFLWGLPLVALPIAIHLLSRRRQEVVKWGAMHLLMDSNIRRRKIWRLDDLILMLLRALAVACLVLALARPLWQGSSFRGGSERDVIFVWDVSLSMQQELANGVAFDRLLDKTETLLGQLGTSDAIRGLVTIGKGEWLIPRSLSATSDHKQQLLDALKKVGKTETTADWIACLETALRVSPPEKARARFVIVVSDSQAQGWHPADQTAWQNIIRLAEESRVPTSIEIHNVVGAPVAIHNLAIDKLSTSRYLLGIREPFEVQAEVRNYGGTSITQASLQWSIDDVLLGTTIVGPIGPGKSAQSVWKHASGTPGINRLKCRLELPDQLPADNERELILEMIDHVSLLLVDDSTESDPLKTDRGYLLAALGQSPDGIGGRNELSVFQVTTVAPGELAESPLGPYRAIVFANVPGLEESAVTKVTEFVRRGGGLWLALGDRTLPQEFNRGFYRDGTGLCPWPIEESRGDLIHREEFLTIHPPARDHPATLLLSDTQRLDIDRAKIFQSFPFAPAPSRTKVPVLLSSGTGEAVAIEGFLGRGRVFVQSFPLGVRWSNLPLTQAYVPYVNEWLRYLIQPTGVSRNLLPGEPLQLTLPENEHVREVQIKSPGSDQALIATTFRQSDQTIAQYKKTQLPGSYQATVKFEGKPDETHFYQVARPAEESNLDPWPAELVAQWSDAAVIRIDPTERLKLPEGAARDAIGNPLWSSLLVLVVVCLLAEVWLTRHIARKRFGFQTASSANLPAVTRRTSSQFGVEGGG